MKEKIRIFTTRPCIESRPDMVEISSSYLVSESRKARHSGIYMESLAARGFNKCNKLHDAGHNYTSIFQAKK